MVIGEHGSDCEGPDEDGDWICPISSKEPGPCPSCLHTYGIETEMTLADTAPERVWYLCYLCAHGCG
jgi:hypothetical protein